MTQQQFPPQFQQPVPQQGYPPQAYPQQQYAQPPVQQFPQAPPIQAQPLANGTLDDFYSQPSTGGGPAISWKNKPDGTFYIGTVARDVTSGDVQHDTDPQTKQPKYFRDGRPMFSMKIPLKVQSPEFPEGEANLYVRGALRDELARAMSEAGVEGSPAAGDVLQVTLVGRKAGQGAIPKNVFAVVYQRQGTNGTGAPFPAPEQQAPQQAVQPAQQFQPQPQVQQYAPQAQAAPMQQPQQYASAPQQFQQPVPQVAQVQQAPAPATPEGMTPEQAQLMAKLTGQQPQG